MENRYPKGHEIERKDGTQYRIDAVKDQTNPGATCTRCGLPNYADVYYIVHVRKPGKEFKKFFACPLCVRNIFGPVPEVYTAVEETSTDDGDYRSPSELRSLLSATPNQLLHLAMDGAVRKRLVGQSKEVRFEFNDAKKALLTATA